MQKIPEGHTTIYPRLRLFKDDLEQLTQLFESNFDKVEIAADNYRLSKLTDIDQLKEPIITKFMLIGTPDFNKPNYSLGEGVSLYLEADGTTLRITDKDNALYQGVEYQINTILQKRKPHFLSYSWLPISTSILLEGIFILIVTFVPCLATFLFYAASLTIALISFLLVRASLKFYTIIELRDSNNKTNFFIRKKDEILLILLGGLSGAFFGILGTLLVQWLSQ